MGYRYKLNCLSIEWERVAELLSYYGLSNFDADMERKVFENSYAVVFVYDEDNLIGFGRAISDGICQAAIYNVALDERYHGQGLGKEIINRIIEQVSQCNIILYTHPKTVGLYEHLGFRRMKTGMAIYQKEHIKDMEEMDFI